MSRPMTLRQQLAIAVSANYPGTTASKQFLDDCMMFVDRYSQEIAREAEYNKGVVEGLKLVSDAEISGTWVNPVTGAKMYNQGYLDEAAREARLDELNQLLPLFRDHIGEYDDVFTERIAELTQKPPQEGV